MEIIVSVMGIVLAAMMIIVVRREAILGGLKQEVVAFKEKCEQLKGEKSDIEGRLALINHEREVALHEVNRLQTLQEALKIQQDEAQKAFAEQKNYWKDELTNAMQKVLDGKIQKFDETSTKALEGLLTPFKENIEGFRKKVEEGQKESGERFVALSKELEYIHKAGMSISQEASNLTKALKSEKQTQGRWGEMVLESVLEHSGLIKGEHYVTQESFKDEEGNHKRPDVLVKLPQGKSIIIDSKVSLVDYDALIRSETPEQRVVASKGISKAFRNHIDTLSSKEYTHYDTGTLQYIFMFVPIEGAYAVAVESDPTLYEYALQKHIVIVYPSTLVVTLKTIYMYWQREKSDVAVEKIFEEAGKMYDKVCGFVETFERIEGQIATMTKSYQTAKTQLQGHGGLASRAEKLKELGAKTTKKLKAKNRVDFEDIQEEATPLLEG